MLQDSPGEESLGQRGTCDVTCEQGTRPFSCRACLDGSGVSIASFLARATTDERDVESVAARGGSLHGSDFVTRIAGP